MSLERLLAEPGVRRRRRLYRPEPVGRYPHLRREEAALWDQWLREHGAEWEWVVYDATLGDPVPAPAWVDDATRAVWEHLTKLRVDAVVGRGAEVLVVEVKPRAPAWAHAQARAYRDVGAEEGLWPEDARAGVVTDAITPASAKVAAILGVEVWVV